MKLQQILSKINLNSVTSEQIGRCHLIIDGQTGERFYKVESESDATVEYEVRYSREKGFSCQCKSGQVGFSNARLGVCKHVVWSLAAAAEERQALAEQAQKAQAPVLILDGKVQPQEIVEALYKRPAFMPTKREIAQNDRNSNKPFSLFR